MAAIQQDDYFASAEETDETPPANPEAQSASSHRERMEIMDRLDQLEETLSRNKQELRDFGMYACITTWRFTISDT